MSNSTDKMDVQIVKTEWENGKEWVKVTLKNGRSFFPSFEDMHRIVRAICECEDRKYENGEGRSMVARFLIGCVETESFEELAKDFNIPIRAGKRVVNPNGSKINGRTP